MIMTHNALRARRFGRLLATADCSNYCICNIGYFCILFSVELDQHIVPVRDSDVSTANVGMPCNLSADTGTQ